MKRIINSILDLDLYKLTMQSAVIKQFPKEKVIYSFINRGGTKFPEGFGNELRYQIKKTENLRLTYDEKEWLKRTCPYFTPPYIDFLNGYQFDSSEVGIIQNNGDLEIKIEGYWYRTILWETIIMSIISELYFKMIGAEPHRKNIRERNNTKKASHYKFNSVFFADFGTRRRYSYKIQKELIKDLKNFELNNHNFIGTSNVHFAHKYNLKPVGTHAHEWFMFHAAKYGYDIANKIALENWIKIFNGNLGIALTDTYTTDVFLKSFNNDLANLYDGVRHDSGDPIFFIDKIIKHYVNLGINPKNKTIVFSDSLNPDIVTKIMKHAKNKIKTSMGIGTNFTNDVGVKPLNMVIKMTSVKNGNEWIPTVKLSDEPNKNSGDLNEIEIVKNSLGV